MKQFTVCKTFLKEESTKLALQLAISLTVFFKESKTEPEISFFLPQNMLPTLPSMQLDYRHFGHRFKRLMIVAANVALIRGEEGATELHKHRFWSKFA